MSKFLRTTIVIIVLTAMLATLIGCSPAVSPTTSTNKPNETTKGDPVAITAMLQKHTTTDAVVNRVKLFTDSTGITVNFDIQPQEQILDKVQIMLSSGSSDNDIIMYDYIFTTQYANAEWLLPLDDMITAKKVDTSDFMTGYLDAFAVDGVQYGFPIYGESTMLMWNKDLFAKVGLTAAPTNKAEFLSALEKLKAAGIAGYASRGNKDSGGCVFIWTGYMLAAGGNWFGADGKTDFNSPETIAATELYAKLLNDYGIEGGTNLTWDQVQLAFQQGKVAMIIDATNFASRVENPDQSTISGKIGYAELPEDLVDKAIGCWGLAIPKNSKQPDAAFDFINWVLSKDEQLNGAINEMRADVTRQSVMKDPKYAETYNFDNGKWVEVCVNSINTANVDYRPRIAEWSILGDAAAVAVSNVISGVSTAADAMKAADEQCKDVTLK